MLTLSVILKRFFCAKDLPECLKLKCAFQALGHEREIFGQSHDSAFQDGNIAGDPSAKRRPQDDRLYIVLNSALTATLP